MLEFFFDKTKLETELPWERDESINLDIFQVIEVI